MRLSDVDPPLPPLLRGKTILDFARESGKLGAVKEKYKLKKQNLITEFDAGAYNSLIAHFDQEKQNMAGEFKQAADKYVKQSNDAIVIASDEGYMAGRKDGWDTAGPLYPYCINKFIIWFEDLKLTCSKPT